MKQKTPKISPEAGAHHIWLSIFASSQFKQEGQQ
jgi:hypothetical protein